LFPFKQHAKRAIKEELNILIQKGFSRIYLRKMTDDSTQMPELLRIEELLEKEEAALG
jgi:excinuclease ABC subunit A